MGIEQQARVMTPEGFTLEERDEWSHVPDDKVNFNESVYVNAFDATLRAGAWMRLGNRVNEGYAELSVCIYLPDGRIACQFARPKISINERFEAGGLRYAVSEPFERVEMHYDGELLLLDDPSALRNPKEMFASAPRVDGAVRMNARAVSPAHGGEPTAPDYHRHMLYGPDFSRGHFNQHVAVDGSIRVGEERFTFETAFGWRDHSWGPRYWQAIWFYRLLIANFGEDRAFMLLRNTSADGRSRRLGTVLIDGRYEEVLDLDVTTEWSSEQDPVAVTIGVRTETCKSLIHGRVLTLAPLRNRRRDGDEVLVSRVAEGFSEFTWDGRTGYGIMEYIERIEDGRPVGYPL